MGVIEGYSFIKKKCFVCGSLSHLIKDCDYYEKKMAREAEVKKQRVVNTDNKVAKPVWTNANRVNHANKLVPRSVQLKCFILEHPMKKHVDRGLRWNSMWGLLPLDWGRHRIHICGLLSLDAGWGNQYTFKGNVKGVGYRWMFDIDYLTDSMNYIPVFLKNQANPHAGGSEVTNSARTSQTQNSNAFEEKDEDVELIVVPLAVKNTEEKVKSRTSSTNSKKEEILTEPQQEKGVSSTDTSEDNPKILAFRRELEEIALKYLGTVSRNNSTSTPSVNSGSEPVNTGELDPDDSAMPELEIFHQSETGIFDKASYDEEGVVTDFNSLPTEIEVSPTPTLRIHNIHPKSQILGDPKSAVQTRSKVQQKLGAHALFIYIQKQQRNNHKDQ
ncbi:hypothetical protein Tco_1068364, partial [Tanacetum coccineum]